MNTSLTDIVSEKIEQFLLAYYSQKALDEMCAPPLGEHDPMRESAIKVLKDITSKDAGLAKEMEEFTPWESCRISLVRDVLVRRWVKRVEAQAA